MTAPICVRKLFESRGVENFCACVNCREEKDKRDALRFYREDRGSGPRHSDPFPEKGDPK